jgi:hypothetical protein
MLIEWIGVGGDFDPFAAPGNDREDRSPGWNDPHIVLQLWHVFLGGRFLRERPGQHEFGLKDRITALNPSVERRRHPPQRRVPDSLLDIGDDLAGISLVPAAIELLRSDTQLDDEIAGEVLGLDFAAFFSPEPDEGGLIAAEPPMKYRRSAIFLGVCPIIAILDIPFRQNSSYFPSSLRLVSS